MEEFVAVNMSGKRGGSGPEIASTPPNDDLLAITDSGAATGSDSGSAIAPSAGTGGLISILKALEIEKSLAADPVVVALRYFPSTQGAFAPLPDDLSPKLAEYLRSRGLEQLYTHQRAAYDLAKAGKSFVVTTPTASGKTLCYNLPVLDSIIKNTDTRALYLFPTKALRRIRWPSCGPRPGVACASGGSRYQTIEGLGEDIATFTYDGDTPQDARKAIRSKAHRRDEPRHAAQGHPSPSHPSG